MSRRHPATPATPPTDSETPFEPRGLDGYHVIRTLGIGSRSRVYLAHADVECTEPSVALKVFIADLPDADVDTEVCALERVSSLHVVRLLDTSAYPGAARCLILERLEGGTLATLLRDRVWIRIGEAVTILVSVFRGIRDLHGAGFAHNSLSLSSVLFDRAGRPVIIGLGHASWLEPPAAADAQRGGAQRDGAPHDGAPHDGVQADWERYRTIAHAVLDHIETESRRQEVSAVSAGLDRLVEYGFAGAHDSSAESFEDVLFALDQAAPVVLRRTVVASASHNMLPARQDGASRGSVTIPVADVKPAHQRAGPPQGEPRAIRPSIAARVEAVLDAGPIRALGARLLPMLHRRKRSLVFACVVAGIVALTMLAVIPPESSRAQPDHAPHSASQLRTSSPAPPATTPATSVTHSDDDPVTATMALLQKRTQCLGSSSRACLDAVDQSDSAQQAVDRELLAPGVSPAPGRFIDYSSFKVSLIQRTGDSALVELTPIDRAEGQPASALVIKEEAGWRIREIFQN